MKIITNDAIYIQKNDIFYLRHTNLYIPIPSSVDYINISDKDRYEFIKYEDEKDIEFLKNLDLIINYDEFKDLSEEEIINLGQSIAQEKNRIANKFNSMPEKFREENIDIVEEKCKLLGFKMYSLRDLLLFKKGMLKMNLPDGIPYPSEYHQNEDKGLKKILKKIFKNK